MGHAISGRLGQLLQLTAGKKAKKVHPLRLPRPEYLDQKKGGKGRRIKNAGEFVDFVRGLGGK